MNYFEIFELPVQYQIDTEQLAISYRELQKQFHPDNFATASEQDKRLSVQKTAQINDAYNTLEDPVLRAEYLLNVQFNVDLRQQDNVQDTEFLMQQIELHEAVSTAQDLETLDALSLKVRSMHDAWLKLFEQSIDAQNPSQAILYLIRLRFARKVFSMIESREERLY